MHQEAELRNAIEGFLDRPEHDFSQLGAREVHARIRDYVESQEGMRWSRIPAARPSLAWRIRETLHLVAVPLLLLILLPVLIVGLPVWIVLIRIHELRDEPSLGGWQSGLTTVSGKRKPSFDAFRRLADLAVANEDRFAEANARYGMARAVLDSTAEMPGEQGRQEAARLAQEALETAVAAGHPTATLAGIRMIEAGGTKQLLIWHVQSLNSLNPETGEVYWSEPLAPAYNMPITAPRQAGDYLYASGIGSVAALYKLDRATNGLAAISLEAWSDGKLIATGSSTALLLPRAT